MSDELATSYSGRFDLHDDQAVMKAVVTVGRGDYDQLVYRDVPVPTLAPGDVLLQVLASSVNNTDINTRLGWYDSSVTASTQDMAGASGLTSQPRQTSGWDHASPFPFIQGSDCCGRLKKEHCGKIALLAHMADARLGA